MARVSPGLISERNFFKTYFHLCRQKIHFRMSQPRVARSGCLCQRRCPHCRAPNTPFTGDHMPICSIGFIGDHPQGSGKRVKTNDKQWWFLLSGCGCSSITATSLAASNQRPVAQRHYRIPPPEKTAEYANVALILALRCSLLMWLNLSNSFSAAKACTTHAGNMFPAQIH